jgi:hypothetical protein
MSEEWRIMILDDTTIYYIYIHRTNGRAVMLVSTAVKYTVYVSIDVDWKRVCRMGQKLWVLLASTWIVQLSQLYPSSAHIPLNLVLGTLDRSLAAPK